MTLDYAVCPHCGCRCEDDEYCAACGRMFEEDAPVVYCKVSFLDLAQSSFRFLSTHIKKPKISHDIGEGGNINPLPGSSWHLHRHK